MCFALKNINNLLNFIFLIIKMFIFFAAYFIYYRNLKTIFAYFHV